MCTSGEQTVVAGPAATQAQAYKIASQTRKVGEPVQARTLAGAADVSVTEAPMGGRSSFGGDQKLAPDIGGGGGSNVTTPLGGARMSAGGGGGGGGGRRRNGVPIGSSSSADRAAGIEAYRLGNSGYLSRREKYAA